MLRRIFKFILSLISKSSSMSDKTPRKTSENGPTPHAETPQKGKDFNGLAEKYVGSAEDFHAHAEQFVASGEDTSSEIMTSAETMLATAEHFPEGIAEFPGAEQHLIRQGAEMAEAGAEMFHAEAEQLSAEHGESGEHFMTGAAEIFAAAEHGAESLVPGAEHVVHGAELFAEAEHSAEHSAENAPLTSAEAAEEFAAGAFDFQSSAMSIVQEYTSAGGVNDNGTYYNTAGVFMRGAEEVLTAAEDFSTLNTSAEGYPDLSTAEMRLESAENTLNTRINLPQQEEGAEIINTGIAEIISAIATSEDMLPAAEVFFKGAETYVNINEDSVEEFNVGGAEIAESAEEFAGNLAAAEEMLLFGAEEVQISAAEFRFLGAETGAEVGGENFVVGGPSDLAEFYVGSPEDLMATAEEILVSAEELAEIAPNAVAEAGAAELTIGAEKLIAASEETAEAEEGSILLNAAAAEVWGGAEEYVRGTGEAEAEAAPSV